jgi:NAD-dependent deacetylase
VRPAAGLCDVAVDSGADLVIINAQPTPYDSMATVIIREPISDALPTLVKAVVPA